MKKQILGLIVAALMMVGSSTHALSVETLTNLSGTSSPTGRFYFPFVADMSLIVGAKATFATGENPSGSTVETLLGLKSTLPILGLVDTYTVWNFSNGIGNTLRWVVFAKSWTTKLTDKVNIGLYIPLIKFATGGSREVSLLSDIQPQIGMNIDIF